MKRFIQLCLLSLAVNVSFADTSLFANLGHQQVKQSHGNLADDFDSFVAEGGRCLTHVTYPRAGGSLDNILSSNFRIQQIEDMDARIPLVDPLNRGSMRVVVYLFNKNADSFVIPLNTVVDFVREYPDSTIDKITYEACSSALTATPMAIYISYKISNN